MLRLIKSFIRQHPALYFSIVGRRESVKRLRAHKNTELVVEAFPRSANTTSVLALFHAQGESFRVGHHLHVAAHIKYAVKHAIPCLVIMRNPLDCVASLMVMRKGGNPSHFLKDYIDFARVVERCLQEVVVVDFGDVTQRRMAFAIEAVNSKYKTEFIVPSGSDEEQQWVRKRVSELNEIYSAGDEESLSIPTAAKHANAEKMKQRIRDESPTELKKAEALYTRLVNPAESILK
jgi:hypothetical protein